LLLSSADSARISSLAKTVMRDCTSKEFNRFEKEEFTGWNNASI